MRCPNFQPSKAQARYKEELHNRYNIKQCATMKKYEVKSEDSKLYDVCTDLSAMSHPNPITQGKEIF